MGRWWGKGEGGEMRRGLVGVGRWWGKEGRREMGKGLVGVGRGREGVVGERKIENN